MLPALIGLAIGALGLAASPNGLHPLGTTASVMPDTTFTVSVPPLGVPATIPPQDVTGDDKPATDPQGQLRYLPPDSIDALRLGIAIGAFSAGNVAAYIYQQRLWWGREHLGGFRFHTDGGYSEHLDKVSHAYATYVQGLMYARTLRWSGVSPEASALWASVAAWLVQLNVEIRDGFSEEWGFDIYDVVANTVGSGWFYAREHVPQLEPFVWKLSYWPSEHFWNHDEAAFGDRPASPVTDYMGHTYWVSARVHDLLPESARTYWPRWLALAAGVSGDALYTADAQRSYYLALDVDLEGIFPARTWLAASGIELLNRMKLPMPAVRLHPRPTFYLVYYGQQ